MSPIKFRQMFTGRYSWITNTITGGALFVIGDTIEQNIEIFRGKHIKNEFDWDRLRRIGTIGILEGPTHHYFYKYLDTLLPGKTPATVAKKIFFDQAIGSPFFAIQFFVGVSLLEGQSLRNSWREFFQKFPYVFLVDCCVWPPFQCINFFLIPSRYRVLYVNFVTVLWNVFLSYMKHYDHLGIGVDGEKKSSAVTETEPVTNKTTTPTKPS